MSKIIFPIFIAAIAALFIYRTWTNNKIADENFRNGQEFLESNAKEEGVITTDSGLQYKVLQEGTGTESPSKTHHVKVHYHGTLTNGTVFDSSVERNEPITFSLNQVIEGWQEGLQYMVEGQKIRLFVPSTLGYGRKGVGPIPPSSVLIFDIELIEIQK